MSLAAARLKCLTTGLCTRVASTKSARLGLCWVARYVLVARWSWIWSSVSLSRRLGWHGQHFALTLSRARHLLQVRLG